jgi:hypothetical protein
VRRKTEESVVEVTCRVRSRGSLKARGEDHPGAGAGRLGHGARRSGARGGFRRSDRDDRGGRSDKGQGDPPAQRQARSQHHSGASNWVATGVC